jgi:hypothetical protein
MMDLLDKIRAFQAKLRTPEVQTFLVKTEDVMKRYRAARANPKNPKSKPWLVIDGLPVHLVLEASLIKYLPDPSAKRGAPPGGGRVQKLLAKVEAGELTEDQALGDEAWRNTGEKTKRRALNGRKRQGAK